jgi:hypothetical protein
VDSSDVCVLHRHDDGSEELAGMRDTIDMAREAGISPAFSGHPDHPERTKDGELKYWAGVNHITLKAFEDLVRADERERIKEENQRCYVARGNT